MSAAPPPGRSPKLTGRVDGGTIGAGPSEAGRWHRGSQAPNREDRSSRGGRRTRRSPQFFPMTGAWWSYREYRVQSAERPAAAGWADFRIFFQPPHAPFHRPGLDASRKIRQKGIRPRFHARSVNQAAPKRPRLKDKIAPMRRSWGPLRSHATKGRAAAMKAS